MTHLEIRTYQVYLTCGRKLAPRTILTTCYAAGLRISEAVHLRPTDIDSGRMVIRIEQGKGQHDRYMMRSPKLLTILRAWWRENRPSGWLFPAVRPWSSRPERGSFHLS